jgi:hypothetical protein
MQWRTIISSLAVFSSTVAAFRDTSPYILLSTSKCARFPLKAGQKANYLRRIPSSFQERSTGQVQDSYDVVEDTKAFLSACPSDTYIIISQPALHSDDLSSKAIPYLWRAMSSNNMRIRIGISDVVGQVDPENIKNYLVSHCSAGFISLDGSSKLNR